MASQSSESISDIVANAENMEEDAELIDEEVLEQAAPIQRREGNAFNVLDVDALEYIPTIQKAREEAQIPDHVSVKDLVGKRIAIARKWEQKAALPDTGELRNGFFCDIVDMQTRKAQTVWIGQVALMRDLELLRLPIQTTIIKVGRTYRFA